MECPECGSKTIKRNGKTYGKQRFVCANKHTFFAKQDYSDRMKKLFKWYVG